MDLLTINWNLDPVICRTGSGDIRWYSLFFVSSILWGWFYARWVARREKISSDVYVPLLFWLLVGFMVGGKLGYRVFFATGSFAGFSSFGAAIGIFVAVCFFSLTAGRRNKLSFLWVMDRLMPCGMIGCVLVRFGNFCNSELFGTPTKLPWGVVFERTGDMAARHPVQIYEAVVFLLMGLIMIWLYRRRIDKLPAGFIAGISVMAVSLARFLLEFFKAENNPVDIGPFQLHIAQLLCIPLFLFGAGIFIYALRRK